MYSNGEIAPTGPHFRKGGYNLWNWCVKCECVWEKKISWCQKCNCRLRFKGRYISRRNKESVQMKPEEMFIVLYLVASALSFWWYQ